VKLSSANVSAKFAQYSTREHFKLYKALKNYQQLFLSSLTVEYSVSVVVAFAVNARFGHPTSSMIFHLVLQPGILLFQFLWILRLSTSEMKVCLSYLSLQLALLPDIEHHHEHNIFVV
jgi:hypothetical protein